MNQFALRAVAWNDIILAVLAAFQRGLAIVEAETRFGALRPVAAKTGLFKNRFDVALEINRDAGRRRQSSNVDLGAAKRQPGGRQEDRQDKTALDRGAALHRRYRLRSFSSAFFCSCLTRVWPGGNPRSSTCPGSKDRSDPAFRRTCDRWRFEPAHDISNKGSHRVRRAVSR